MQATRQTWTVVIMAVILAGLSPITASVLPAVGASVLFGWLLAVQIAAIRSFRATVTATSVQIEPEVSRARANKEFPVTATVKRPGSETETEVMVTFPKPPTAQPASVVDRRITLEPDETYATTTYTVQIPVAGEFTLPKPSWSISDPYGAFTETYVRGPTPKIQLLESVARNLHVGRGGAQVTVFGEHTGTHTGKGLIPEKTRPYVETDPANWIDWKATARLGEAHVREFETESNRQVKMLVDHRAKMGIGFDGEQTTALMYVRDVALGIVSTAENAGDPIRFVAVGDDGITNLIQGVHRSTRYDEIRQRLLDLEPTPTSGPTSTVELDHPESARRLVRELGDGKSEFERVVHAFATATTSYVQRLSSDPLSQAVRHERANNGGFTGVTVILTDDTERSDIWKIARVADRDRGETFLFLAPRVFYDPQGLDNIERAYEQYLEFERFRERLCRLESVTAFEVAPADRLQAVISGSQSGPGSLYNRSEGSTRRTGRTQSSVSGGTIDG
ncbi:DUF58 domain-containing protein [Natronocalculus amylovorans]|uniref:DUF58 domain-containing protein n=1 Tax=Natronocalculus amylovorans TaxID=2917812 RepID=A0AAE3FZH0_9EURY|nr:DUF58 domain-containing protein [Natronocalculus amylovorans]MCL9818288.1 DUF58 domain-containing protein [Natronocalculus amylovorans]